MQHDDYLNELKRIVENNLDIFRPCTQKFLNLGTINTLHNCLVYSKHLICANLVANLMISRHFKIPLSTTFKVDELIVDIAVGNVKAQATYYSNKYFFEYPLLETKGNDKHLLSKVIRSISSTKSIVPGSKHIVKIIITQRLTKNMCDALKNAMEYFSDSSFFVLVTLSLSHIENNVVNQCMLVNANMLVQRVVSHLTDDKELSHAIANCTTDPVSAIMYYNKGIPKVDTLLELIRHNITTWLDMKSKQDWTIVLFEDIHNVTLKLMNTFIPFCMICHKMIEYFQTEFPEKLEDCVAICAKHEHMCVTVNKACFVYDSFFWDIVVLSCRS